MNMKIQLLLTMMLSVVLIVISLKISGQMDKNTSCSSKMRRANRLLLVLGISGLVFSLTNILVLRNCNCADMKVEQTMMRMGVMALGLTLLVLGIMLATSKNCGEISFDSTLVALIGGGMMAMSAYGMYVQYSVKQAVQLSPVFQELFSLSA